jgi:predicted kinase
MWKFPLYEVGKPIDWDLMEYTYDWIRDMKETIQDSIWHQEGDVLTHTKMVIEELLKLPEYGLLSEQDKHIVFTSALMHDIEKRSTTTVEFEDGMERIRSFRHGKRGEATVREILYKDIETPFKIREQIAKLVRWHSAPSWTIDKEDPVKDVVRLSLETNTNLLYILAKADTLGRIADDYDETLIKIELFKDLCKENRCFAQKKEFKNDYDRYMYLNKKGFHPSVEFYDETKFTVYVLCGLPGVGKDYFINNPVNGMSNLPVLSLDDIRREHKIKPTDKKGNGRVIQMGKEKAKEFMRKKCSFIYNATNITADMRNKWVSLFMEYGAYVKIIYLEVPHQKLLSQNKNREHVVPGYVIDKMLGKLEIPTYSEAHTIIYQIKS